MKQDLIRLLFVISCICLPYFMGKVWKENVHVINPDDSRNLPVYCVNTKKKEVALTFNVAWGNEDMGKILKILKDENIKSTFFMTGEWVSNYPDDVKKIAKAGHDLGNHGDRHKYMTQMGVEEQKKEIMEVHEKVKLLTGQDMDLFRPPYGDYDDTVIKTARENGYQSIQWSVDSLDWKEYGKEDLIHRVIDHKSFENGTIILLHTGTKYTVQALKELIHKIKEKGYTIVPVSKLIYKNHYYIDFSGKQYTKQK